MRRSLVYIVDDDDAIREVVGAVLAEFGYEARGYKNGREAVDALANDERPNLILLDWMMPVMNGAEFVRQNEVQEIPVVVISAVADRIGEVPEVRERAIKPIDIFDLVRIVDRYCLATTAATPEPRSTAV